MKGAGSRGAMIAYSLSRMVSRKQRNARKAAADKSKPAPTAEVPPPPNIGSAVATAERTQTGPEAGVAAATASLAKDTERIVPLAPWQVKLLHTPFKDRKTDLFSYPIFRSGTMHEHLVIDGTERKELAADEKRRWDYFFRPDLSLIDVVDRLRLSAIDGQRRYHRGRVWSYGTLIGVFVLMGLGFAIWFQNGLLAWLALAGLAPLLPMLMSFFELLHLAARREHMLTFRTVLEKQIPTDIPSDAEIETLFRERVEQFREEARQHLAADHEDVAPDEVLVVYGLASSSRRSEEKGVIEWPEHLIARRGLLFCNTYVRFIFPCRERLATHGLFYDLIRNRRRGALNQVFYYDQIGAVTSREVYGVIQNHEVQALIDSAERQSLLGEPRRTDPRGQLAAVALEISAPNEKFDIFLIGPELRRSMLDEVAKRRMWLKERRKKLREEAPKSRDDALRLAALEPLITATDARLAADETAIGRVLPLELTDPHTTAQRLDRVVQERRARMGGAPAQGISRVSLNQALSGRPAGNGADSARSVDDWGTAKDRD